MNALATSPLQGIELGDLPTVVVALALAVALALLAGLTRSANGARAARACAALAWLAVAWAALDRRETVTAVEQPRGWIAATVAVDAAADDPLATALQGIAAAAGLPPPAVVRAGDPRVALAVAALGAEQPADLALVWAGSFTPTATGAPRGCTALTAVPPLGFDPAALAVRALGPATAGRPASLELGAPTALRAQLPPAATVVLEVGEPVVARREWSGDALRHGGASLRLDWLPEQVGTLPVALRVELGERAVVARGELAIAAPRPDVAVLGPGSELVAAALAAQGLRVERPGAVASAPAGAVIVALGSLDAAAVDELVSRVDDGGGLVLVGGPGGALPRDGEALASWSPLRLRPVGDGGTGGAGVADGGGEPGAPATGEPGAPAGPELPPDFEPPPRDPGQATAPPGPAPTGDTSAARSSRDLETAEVERRQVCLVLVVDRSGSMGEWADARSRASKLDLVKTAAFRIAASLEPTDELAVVAFDDVAEEIVALGPVPDEARLRRDFERLGPLGGTRIDTGLRRGEQVVGRSRAPVRHVLVLTDGDDLPLADVSGARNAADRIARAGGTVSVIQVTSSSLIADVAAIATAGRGQYRKVEDASAIPTFLFAEVRRALGAARRSEPGGRPEPGEPAAARAGDAPAAEAQTGGSDPLGPSAAAAEPAPPAAAEPAAAPVAPAVPVFAVDDTPLVEPWLDAGFPPLAAVDAAVADARAQVVLAAADGTPVLAFTNRGLGRVAAFASDWAGAGAAPWREDPRFPAWLATWVRAVAPRETAAPGGDLLGPRAIAPPAPTPAEVAALEALAGSPLRPLAELALPRARTTRSERGRAADDALWALVVLLLLALVERATSGR
ncbi:MAG: VWA domain-containing protein [Planctomycetes bacterium]|nr:VWA domain-containing protein [Planctomycetota bacterium]